MFESIFDILGLEYSALQISDAALLVVVALVFLYSIDWILRLVSMVVGTLTKRR